VQRRPEGARKQPGAAEKTHEFVYVRVATLFSDNVGHHTDYTVVAERAFNIVMRVAAKPELLFTRAADTMQYRLAVAEDKEYITAAIFAAAHRGDIYPVVFGLEKRSHAPPGNGKPEALSRGDYLPHRRNALGSRGFVYVVQVRHLIVFV